MRQAVLHCGTHLPSDVFRMGIEIGIIIEGRGSVVAGIVVVIDGCLVCSVPVAGVSGVGPEVGCVPVSRRHGWGVVEVAGVGEPVAVVLKGIYSLIRADQPLNPYHTAVIVSHGAVGRPGVVCLVGERRRSGSVVSRPWRGLVLIARSDVGSDIGQGGIPGEEDGRPSARVRHHLCRRGDAAEGVVWHSSRQRSEWD